MKYSHIVLPLPLYINRKQMNDYEPVEERPMSDVIPMRINATIIDILEDGLISFRWTNDERNLKRYQAKLNNFYREQNVDPIIQLQKDRTYIVHYEKKYCRCNVLDPFSIHKEKNVHLIDYGKIVKIESADFYYFHHHESWEEPDYRFAYSGLCRIADNNQCIQLDLPSAGEFSAGEEVEIYLLSAAEPCYAVLSSIRNPDATLLKKRLILDFMPDFAEVWNDVTENVLEPVPAERPTLLPGPHWIHGNYPVLVTIPHIESIGKFVVCDLLCSLRACILTDYLHNNYGQPEVKQEFCIIDPCSQLGIGVIVIARDVKTDRYYRARITENHASMQYFNLVGIDFPQWKSHMHSINEIWLLSTTLEFLPRMNHLIPYRENLRYRRRVKRRAAKVSRGYIKPYTVALLQYKGNAMLPAIVIPDRHYNKSHLCVLLRPNKHSFRSPYTCKQWLNKSKIEVKATRAYSGFLKVEEDKEEEEVKLEEAPSKKPLLSSSFIFPRKKKITATPDW